MREEKEFSKYFPQSIIEDVRNNIEYAKDVAKKRIEEEKQKNPNINEALFDFLMFPEGIYMGLSIIPKEDFTLFRDIILSCQTNEKEEKNNIKPKDKFNTKIKVFIPPIAYTDALLTVLVNVYFLEEYMFDILLDSFIRFYKTREDIIRSLGHFYSPLKIQELRPENVCHRIQYYELDLQQIHCNERPCIYMIDYVIIYEDPSIQEDYIEYPEQHKYTFLFTCEYHKQKVLQFLDDQKLNYKLYSLQKCIINGGIEGYETVLC